MGDSRKSWLVRVSETTQELTMGFYMPSNIHQQLIRFSF